MNAFLRFFLVSIIISSGIHSIAQEKEYPRKFNFDKKKSKSKIEKKVELAI